MDKTIHNWFNSLDKEFDGDKVDPNSNSVFHFKISGEEGGEYTVIIENSKLHVATGLIEKSKCEISATDQNFKNILLRISNPGIALANGKLKITNVAEVLRFAKPLGLL